MTTPGGHVRGRVSASTGEPLPGVLVSNGLTVRRTNHDGTFELGAGGSGFVFVTRPTGFTATDWSRRVTDGTASYDFTLEAAHQPVPFTLAQVTDLHLCVEEEPARVEIPDNPFGTDLVASEVRWPISTADDVASLLEELSTLPTPDGRGVAFVAATGDLTDKGVPAEYAAFAEVLGAAPIQGEVLPGNHDHYGHRY